MRRYNLLHWVAIVRIGAYRQRQLRQPLTLQWGITFGGIRRFSGERVRIGIFVAYDR
jgi:hypothetical protein